MSVRFFRTRLGVDLGPNCDAEIKQQLPVYFNVENQDDAISLHTKYLSMPSTSQLFRTQRSIGLSNNNPDRKRPALTGRKRGSVVDPALITRWLHLCHAEHKVQCNLMWSDRLETSRMIDVKARKIVDCPANCQYVALSYMWEASVLGQARSKLERCQGPSKTPYS